MESCNPYQDIPFFDEKKVSSDLNMMNIYHGFKLSYEAFYYIINRIAHPSNDFTVISKNIFPWNSKLYHNIFSGKYSNEDSFFEDVNKIFEEIKYTCSINKDLCKNAFSDLKRLIHSTYDESNSIFNTPEILISFEFDVSEFSNLNLFLTQLHSSPPMVIRSLYYNWSIFHPDVTYSNEYTDFSGSIPIERFEQDNKAISYDFSVINNSKYKTILDTSSFLQKNLKNYEIKDDDDDDDDDDIREEKIDFSHFQLVYERNFIPINSKKLQNLYPEDHLIKELLAFMTLNTFHLIDNMIYSSNVDNHNNKINNGQLKSKSKNNIHNGKNNNNNFSINNSMDYTNNLQILYFILCKCYKCNCNYYAPSLPYLFRHLERKHPIPKEEVQIIQKFICPVDKCHYKVQNKIKFLNHILQHNFYGNFENLKYLDNSSLVYRCVYPECSFHTKNEMSFTTHILNHTKQVKKKTTK